MLTVNCNSNSDIQFNKYSFSVQNITHHGWDIKRRKKMKRMTTNLSLIFLVMIVFLYGQDVWANKSATSIEVPENITKGSEITIRVTVTHSANSFIHYTKWLQIMINGKEIERWDYTMGNRPEGATFTKEIKYKAEGDIEIKAEASCNVHGSTGPSTVKVSVKE
jgi:desulfoferrodoxin (superoxide reductase-like protein)